MHDMKEICISRKVHYLAKQAIKNNLREDAECVVFMGIKSLLLWGYNDNRDINLN